MTFPATVQDIKVELLGVVTAAVWTDVTTYVQRRDGGINITRGRADETSTVQPSKATLSFNNRDGRFSPRNPSGAYYGKIGRNTQLRVSILAGTYRFWGEVSQWPTLQDITGNDVYGSSPGMEALGDCRALQLYETRNAQAFDKVVNPPMKGPTSLNGQKISLLPGDTTYTDSMSPSRARHRRAAQRFMRASARTMQGTAMA